GEFFGLGAEGDRRAPCDAKANSPAPSSGTMCPVGLPSTPAHGDPGLPQAVGALLRRELRLLVGVEDLRSALHRDHDSTPGEARGYPELTPRKPVVLAPALASLPGRLRKGRRPPRPRPQPTARSIVVQPLTKDGSGTSRTRSSSRPCWAPFMSRAEK